jgi:hypothetical protein
MHAVNETMNIHPRGFSFFPGERGWKFLPSPSNSPMGGRQTSQSMEFFYYVPNGFPMMFLKGVPNMTSFYCPNFSRLLTHIE